MLNSMRKGVASAFSRLPAKSNLAVPGSERQNVTQQLSQSQLPCLQTQLQQTASLHTSIALQDVPEGQKAPMPPWTPTSQLTKRKVLTKRMGFLLQTLDAEQAAAIDNTRKLPEFGPGDVVEIKMAVPENRRKVALMKGIVIAKKNRGWQSAFTIRNYLGNAGGIERTFPLYSPSLLGLKVLEHCPVRRAKLYYLRGRKPSEYRVQ